MVVQTVEPFQLPSHFHRKSQGFQIDVAQMVGIVISSLSQLPMCHYRPITPSNLPRPAVSSARPKVVTSKAVAAAAVAVVSSARSKAVTSKAVAAAAVAVVSSTRSKAVTSKAVAAAAVAVVSSARLKAVTSKAVAAAAAVDSSASLKADFEHPCRYVCSQVKQRLKRYALSLS